MVTLRAPSSLPATESSASISPPQLSWLSGSWNVTHSTLPMWKKNRNVRITYTPIASSTPPQIDDVVTYQGLNSDALKTVHGIDKPFDVPNAAPPAGAEGGAGDVASLGYNWRGKGWLVIATSKWEILGYGDEQGTGNSWVVTYFAKTLFTPAGIDVYSRKASLTPQAIDDIKAALAALGGDVAKLAGQMFQVRMDQDASG
ncbi:hypothetical protein COCC4DRAFT_34231 [Bipolaris maydis ATCC 48331]|uniref:Uncharacterized protein n=2 Tax=Cochliobolus heterostrophus TaxID=5016 RepID=M2TC92_COCH5|nr:uncharacterized protein COCC4DRAFT_34231 [Bipolaris maydis ATCC 48331]EMD95160.1 hypothetical protein COCHEDRAFT_1019965 [Bipolaris maydis C5]KAH7551230.1 hypothetical protein BM1_10104 [Bipolaris maydis]ENI00948.1 hypothetical protein COCC4DRAFT_34231 [Bipolaris maydis ATCC 48331]KAJ5021795.1 hypothetical protein J3E73DRAFT_347956 [Bipolaris maydis]KAJ5054967.1 hypothetical protein J3E74DRAFT_382697 [Bipolaris maydis]